MDPKRFPSGQRDTGDDAHADSIIEAARYVLDTCVKQTNRGGWTERFSELPHISIDDSRPFSKPSLLLAAWSVQTQD